MKALVKYSSYNNEIESATLPISEDKLFKLTTESLEVEEETLSSIVLSFVDNNIEQGSIEIPKEDVKPFLMLLQSLARQL